MNCRGLPARAACHHRAEEPRAEPVAHERLLDPRKPQEPTHYTAHERVRLASGIVEELILQRLLLQALQDHPRERVLRVDHALLPRMEFHRPRHALQMPLFMLH